MRDLGLTREDHTLLFTSMAHASGAIMLLISSLWMGAEVIVPVFDPPAVLDTWARSRSDSLYGASDDGAGAAGGAAREAEADSTGRLAICGGDTAPISMQQEYAALFSAIPFWRGFGMTEGLPLLANRPESNRPGTMGRPLGDVEVRVMDGEMWLRGSGIATGYWREAPFEEGWLRTGDLVEQDADGFVSFRGRRKEIIVRGGSNISPQEVEDMLYRHPAVAEAGVIGEPDSYWGEVVLAYVALRAGHRASAEELIAFARRHLAEYKCPERVRFLPVLPKGITGKIQRRALRKLQMAAAAG